MIEEYNREREFVHDMVKEIFGDFFDNPDEFIYLELTKDDKTIRGISYEGRFMKELVSKIKESKYFLYSVRGNDDNGYPATIERYPILVNHCTDVIVDTDLELKDKRDYLELGKDIQSNLW